MAYITKRGSSYGVRYTYQDEQGKNCNKWESFSTKEEAVKRQKQIEHELATGNFLIPSTVTVAEFLMDWLPKQCSKHKWSPKTYCNAIQRPTSSDMENTDRAETVQPWLVKQKSHEIFRSTASTIDIPRR